jgi:hypothetical protein
MTYFLAEGLGALSKPVLEVKEEEDIFDTLVFRTNLVLVIREDVVRGLIENLAAYQLEHILLCLYKPSAKRSDDGPSWHLSLNPKSFLVSDWAINEQREQPQAALGNQAIQ